ncbi:transglutaminaseTgpA domain-containing protein [Arthrobacter sp. NEB 688]|uniref:transglutaminaseTgpA domain-containing protein n=1 Tax=Arthrobacter sp. NEB 688 TaxID=904039 RepID=UPI001565E06A|nr:transglutaminaseTgpA domain-containing protein [Arthrobacter sp. NEB 688]QKE83758.1 transglutaminase domain-containing protein [Arthrobacter sp. NEB 688]
MSVLGTLGRPTDRLAPGRGAGVPGPSLLPVQTRRSRRPQPHPLDRVVDVLAVVVLVGAALSGFAGTFLGWSWVLPAGVGLAAGAGVALALGRLRAPWWTLAPALLVVLALLGPPLTLRGTRAGPLPTPAAWGALADTAVDGWLRMLTTLPPVDGSGPLGLLPLLLALVAGGATTMLARRTEAPHLPLLVPAVLAVVVAALGVVEPGGMVARAVVLFVVGITWGADRARRAVVVHSTHSLERAATGALLLAVVGVLVLGAVPWVGAADRQVLRSSVDPPFSATDRPSPLAAFRAFRPDGQLTDDQLFTVRGLPDGTLVRLATVDTYSGTVWAAGDGRASTTPGAGTFLRVGAEIPRPAGGRAVEATVTVQPAWAERKDLRIWVPTVGGETSLSFTGPRAQDLDDALRLNLDTGAAVLADGLRAGETYTLTARLGAPDAVPPATPPVDPPLLQPVAQLVAASVAAGDSPMERLRAVATRLRDTGAYSDGGEGQTTILPGHSLGRLTAFLADRRPAGDDEQYAATLALTAAYLGMPARVVLGAVPGQGGVVLGSDVRAWVEVHDGTRWQLIAPDDFVPPRDRAPEPRTVLDQERNRAAAVPPPTAQRPPSSEDGFTLDEGASGRSRSSAPEVGFSLPVWAVAALAVAAVPAAGLPLWTGLLVLLKGLRRGVRRRRGGPAARTGAAWDDVVDTLRDAGYDVSRRDTRREVARTVGGGALLDAARTVDGSLYGPGGADDTAAERSWALARRTRRELSEGRTLRERWRRAVSLTSLLPERGHERVRRPSAIHAEGVTVGSR